MANRHARSTASTDGASNGTARRVVISAIVVAAVSLATYGYLQFGERPDDGQAVAACSGCTGSSGSGVEDETGRSTSGDVSDSDGLGRRIASAVRNVLGVFESAWHRVVTSDDAPMLGSEAGCESVVRDSSGRCGRTGTGGYARWLGGSSTREPTANLASISGRVLDAQGLGIEGVSMTLVPVRTFTGSKHPGKGMERWPVTRTDTSGFYVFQGLTDGDYEIRTTASDEYSPVRLAARSGVQNADIVLVQDHKLVLEGEVSGVAGERLEAVTVLPVLVGVASVRTDAFGSYRLEVPVKPGTRSFLVRFQLPGFLDSSVPVDLTGRSGTGSLALDVKMQPIEAWTSVSGVVKSASGAPLKGRSVSLRRVGGQTAYTTTTDKHGRYAFDAVEAPVAYQLSVSGAPDHEDYRAKVNVSTNSARFDVVASPFEFGTLSGRLVSADGSPVSNLDLVLRNKASRSANAVVSSDEYGNFRVARAPAGELTIASQSSPSIMARGLRLDPGEERDVALVLDWGDHELSGVVVDHNGNPVPAARVLLTWSHLEGEVTTSTIRRTRSDAQGVFSFSQLGPGPHVLQIDLPGRRSVKKVHDLTREGYFVKVGV